MTTLLGIPACGFGFSPLGCREKWQIKITAYLSFDGACYLPVQPPLQPEQGIDTCYCDASCSIGYFQKGGSGKLAFPTIPRLAQESGQNYSPCHATCRCILLG
jgi:hypothetical protein